MILFLTLLKFLKMFLKVFMQFINIVLIMNTVSHFFIYLKEQQVLHSTH